MSENVKKMFAEISKKYDYMNEFLSFGIHKSWRKKTVEISEAKNGDNVLDCASGTGDLAIEFYERVKPQGSVLATDFCKEMLDIATEKFKIKQLPIKIQIEDVMNLSFNDNTFDIASIAFGIRNVDDTKVGLKELARVVKSGGKVIILEFGQPYGLFSILYRIYSKIFIPLFGKILAKSEFAYNYLQDTANKYPCREEFIKIMNETGKFSKTFFKPLTFGIAYIYVGVVK